MSQKTHVNSRLKLVRVSDWASLKVAVMAQLTPPELFAVTKGCRSRISASAEIICPLCSEKLTGGRMVREHERDREDRGACRCTSCGKSSSCSEDLRRHSRSTGHFIPVTFRLAATDFMPAQAAAQPTTGDDSADHASSAGDREIVQAGSSDSAVVQAGRASLITSNQKFGSVG